MLKNIKILFLVFLCPLLVNSNEITDTSDSNDLNDEYMGNHFAMYLEFIGPNVQLVSGYLEFGVELEEGDDFFNTKKLNFRAGFGLTPLFIYNSAGYSYGSTITFGKNKMLELGIHYSKVGFAKGSRARDHNGELIGQVTTIGPSIGYRSIFDSRLFMIGINPFLYVIEGRRIGISVYISIGFPYELF